MKYSSDIEIDWTSIRDINILYIWINVDIHIARISGTSICQWRLRLHSRSRAEQKSCRARAL